MTIEIRLATPDDKDMLVELLEELGYRVSPLYVHDMLSRMRDDNDPVFVAVAKGAVIGMIALVITRWIQLEKPIARIPAMIVRSQYQRRGVGRQLIEHAVAQAHNVGCGTIELTSANDNTDAHAFYRDMAFEQTSLRFKRVL